jgi:hypothetical protein
MPSRRVFSIGALRNLRESAEVSLGAILERYAAGIYVFTGTTGPPIALSEPHGGITSLEVKTRNISPSAQCNSSSSSAQLSSRERAKRASARLNVKGNVNINSNVS